MQAPVQQIAVSRGGVTIILRAHVVKQRESLSDIAKLYHTTWQNVARLTYSYLGTHPDYLIPGMLVIVEEKA